MREEERRALAATERQIQAEDPELARKLSADVPRAPKLYRVSPYSGALLALSVLCVVLGEWFAAMEVLVLTAAVMWLRGWPVDS